MAIDLDDRFFSSAILSFCLVIPLGLSLYLFEQWNHIIDWLALKWSDRVVLVVFEEARNIPCDGDESENPT